MFDRMDWIHLWASVVRQSPIIRDIAYIPSYRALRLADVLSADDRAAVAAVTSVAVIYRFYWPTPMPPPLPMGAREELEH